MILKATIIFDEALVAFSVLSHPCGDVGTEGEVVNLGAIQLV